LHSDKTLNWHFAGVGRDLFHETSYWGWQKSKCQTDNEKSYHQSVKSTKTFSKLYMKTNNTKFVDTMINHIIILKIVIYPKALVSVPGRSKKIFSPQNIQTCCESYPVSYLKDV
jgi:hypothetical protein